MCWSGGYSTFYPVQSRVVNVSVKNARHLAVKMSIRSDDDEFQLRPQ